MEVFPTPWSPKLGKEETMDWREEISAWREARAERVYRTGGGTGQGQGVHTGQDRGVYKCRKEGMKVKEGR
jgi:hypothetical protein